MPDSKERSAQLPLLTSATRGSLGNPVGYAEAAAVLGLQDLGIIDQEIRTWIPFEDACKKFGRDAIFGRETTYVLSPLDQREQTVTLFAQDAAGLQSIHRLAMLHRNQKSGVELSDIAANTEGVIAVANANSVEAMFNVFDRHHLFLELTQYGDAASAVRRVEAQKLAELYGTPLVAFNPVWRPTNRNFDVALSQILLADSRKQKFPRALLNQPESTFANNIQAYKLLTPYTHSRFHPQGWLQPPKMMKVLFHDAPEAYLSTQVIAERAHGVVLPRPTLPPFPVPEGETSFSYLAKRTEEGFAWRYPEPTQLHRDRLREELSLIEEKGLADMFLVALMAVEVAREHDVELVGMGSGTGSIVNYCLGITEVDPIANGLSFDRFISRATTKNPDTDFDIPQDVHDQFFQWMMERAQQKGMSAYRISTFSKFGVKESVRVILSTFGFPSEDIKKIKHKVDRGHVLDDTPEMRVFERLYHPLSEEGIETGRTAKHGSKLIFHAPRADDIFIYREQEEGPAVAEINRKTAEFEANLDFVSKSGLVLIKRVEKKLGRKIRVVRNDPETIRQIFATETIGVPYLETDWMRRVLHDFAVASGYKNLTDHDIALAIAFSRPAGQGSIPAYLARKSGRIPVVYAHPKLEELLGDTLGIIVFQEQALAVAECIGGFNELEQEQLRKAISKDRGSHAIDPFKEIFMTHAVEMGIAERSARALFAEIEKFAGYGFLKGHVIAEMLGISYKAAFLKRLYPKEFMETLFEMRKNPYFLKDRSEVIVNEARRLGLPVPEDLRLI